jgi:flagellar export protein FliJ
MPPEFSLQTVLDYRATIVETLEIELGQLINQKKELEKAFRMAELREFDLWEQLTKEQVGYMNLSYIDQIRIQLERLEKEKDQLKENLRELNERIDRKREEVVLARQEEETLEIVKEKEIEAYWERVKKQDQKVQDDIYIAQAYQARQ